MSGRLGGPCGTGCCFPRRSTNAARRNPCVGFGPVWTGFYVGAAFGAGGTVNKLDSSTPGFSTTFDGAGGSGVLGSVYGGFDYQVSPRGLLGLLAELTYSGFQGSASAQVPGANANVNSNTGFGWAALARAGVLASPASISSAATPGAIFTATASPRQAARRRASPTTRR